MNNTAQCKTFDAGCLTNIRDALFKGGSKPRYDAYDAGAKAGARKKGSFDYRFVRTRDPIK